MRYLALALSGLLLCVVAGAQDAPETGLACEELALSELSAGHEAARFYRVGESLYLHTGNGEVGLVFLVKGDELAPVTAGDGKPLQYITRLRVDGGRLFTGVFHDKRQAQIYVIDGTQATALTLDSKPVIAGAFTTVGLNGQTWLGVSSDDKTYTFHHLNDHALTPVTYVDGSPLSITGAFEIYPGAKNEPVLEYSIDYTRHRVILDGATTEAARKISWPEELTAVPAMRELTYLDGARFVMAQMYSRKRPRPARSWVEINGRSKFVVDADGARLPELLQWCFNVDGKGVLLGLATPDENSRAVVKNCYALEGNVATPLSMPDEGELAIRLMFVDSVSIPGAVLLKSDDQALWKLSAEGLTRIKTPNGEPFSFRSYVSTTLVRPGARIFATHRGLGLYEIASNEARLISDASSLKGLRSFSGNGERVIFLWETRPKDAVESTQQAASIRADGTQEVFTNDNGAVIELQRADCEMVDNHAWMCGFDPVTKSLRLYRYAFQP